MIIHACEIERKRERDRKKGMTTKQSRFTHVSNKNAKMMVLHSFFCLNFSSSIIIAKPQTKCGHQIKCLPNFKYKYFVEAKQIACVRAINGICANVSLLKQVLAAVVVIGRIVVESFANCDEQNAVVFSFTTLNVSFAMFQTINSMVDFYGTKSLIEL